MNMQVRRAGGDKISLLGQVRRRLFGLSTAEASFTRRGFLTGDEEARRRLEHVGVTFLRGYHSALEETEFASLARRLRRVDAESRGFAFEGAAMGLALFDCLTPWSNDRWRTFTERFAEPHVYMMHVGLGWALARLRRRVTSHLERLDPLLGWLVVDGYGFHEGYFRWRRHVEGRERPARLDGYALRVFDQGLGRSMWFVKGASVSAIAQAVAAFPAARRADLWSGTGLACAYAGGVGRADMQALRAAAADHLPELAQGAAFAAKARQRAANISPHTEAACRVFCGCTAEEAAAITDAALEGLRDEGGLPSYEVWRRRIQTALAREVVRA